MKEFPQRYTGVYGIKSYVLVCCKYPKCTDIQKNNCYLGSTVKQMPDNPREHIDGANLKVSGHTAKHICTVYGSQQHKHKANDAHMQHNVMLTLHLRFQNPPEG